MKTKISLIEMFGTTAPIKWRSTSTGEEGKFNLNGEQLTIVLNDYKAIKLSTGTSTGDIVEFGFSRTIDDKEVITKTNTHDAIKVFSIILNGLLEKFKQNSFPKVLLFSAKKIGPGAAEHEDRARFYSKLQDRISKFGYDKFPAIENSTGTHLILSSTKLTAEEGEEVKKLVSEL